MKIYLYNFLSYFENVIHPAAGKEGSETRKTRTKKSKSQPYTTPDSLNIREMVHKQNSFRRNPAP